VPLQKQIIASDCPCSGFGLKPRRDNALLDLKIKIENYVKPILLVFLCIVENLEVIGSVEPAICFGAISQPFYSW
jgi:hypothetical protein